MALVDDKKLQMIERASRRVLADPGNENEVLVAQVSLDLCGTVRALREALGTALKEWNHQPANIDRDQRYARCQRVYEESKP
jgi:hypothetical protein